MILQNIIKCSILKQGSIKNHSNLLLQNMVLKIEHTNLQFKLRQIISASTLHGFLVTIIGFD